MSDSTPLALVYCEWARDRELVGDLLRSLGVRCHPIESLEPTRRILEEDRADLILADSSGGLEPIRELLALLDDRLANVDLPMVLLASPVDLPLLGELTARRFNAVLLAKPMPREQLAAAIESGLRFRARQKQIRGLLIEVSASNERLAAVNFALEQQREEAAEEAQRKTRFLAAISHDIRTPVNALVLSCQLLKAIGDASPSATIDVHEIDDLTGALLSNASALGELVNDLLDIARHDQGKLEFTESSFAVGDFFATTIEGMRPLAEQKGLALTLDDQTFAAILQTDRIKLARVAQNLVANAIKFTESGHIQVSAMVSAEEGFILEVRDTGIGIPDSMREGIFDEFTQLRNPERDRTKGTGLGLAICRRLVTLMGGQISVVNRPGGSGSIFRVVLPLSRLASAVDSHLAERPTAAAAPQRFQGEVLVVEDHEPSRKLLQRLLRQAGLIVRTAENGRDALDEIERSRPDLVLMDLMMPVMGGMEALRKLRANPATVDLAVIILTGDVGGCNEPNFDDEKASSLLRKPVEVPLLFEILESHFPTANGTTRTGLESTFDQR